VKDAPRRNEESAKGLEAIGGKLKDLYVMMGEYDHVPIAEGPSDEATLGFLLALGAQGNVRTTTLKAFTKEEFVMIKGLIKIVESIE
jgi:uncharacterized protein with GYD domain